MVLRISEEVWQAFPGMRIVVVAGEGLENASQHASIKRFLQQVQDELKRDWSYPNPQSHPHIAAWREAFKQLGLSGKRFPSSIEALARRVLSGHGLGNINPLVDLYNAISLRHVAPAGGWDVDDLLGDILLCRTRGGEPFIELGTSKLVQAEEGEVAYSDGEQLITRHFVWRQSDRGKISEATRRFLLVSEILSPVGEEVARQVRESFEEGLREHFGVRARTEVLDERVKRWEF